jgi:alpha-beta hydrolase superfamily lysophospholipase
MTMLDEVLSYSPLGLALRAGIVHERTDRPFKGTVLYLQGLGDSIRNHAPYFSALRDAGYRVVTFDYPGQGGSPGWMNMTRIGVGNRLMRSVGIGELAKLAWQRFAREPETAKRMVIGWSTGGLAAYRLAHEGWADAVVLLAAGICPRIFVGESARRFYLLPFFAPVITARTLTRNEFEGEPNPHVDPIRPRSPMHAPAFATNLLWNAARSRSWRINPKVRGLALFGGQEDTYVDGNASIRVFARNAPQFETHSYAGALHELDNELPEVALDVRRRTIALFDSVVSTDTQEARVSA